VALLFFVRKFPTGKSEFSGLILWIVTGKMQKLMTHRNICLSMTLFLSFKALTIGAPGK
jgi:hypothetical protein